MSVLKLALLFIFVLHCNGSDSAIAFCTDMFCKAAEEICSSNPNLELFNRMLLSCARYAPYHSQMVLSSVRNHPCFVSLESAVISLISGENCQEKRSLMVFCDYFDKGHCVPPLVAAAAAIIMRFDDVKNAVILFSVAQRLGISVSKEDRFGIDQSDASISIQLRKILQIFEDTAGASSISVNRINSNERMETIRFQRIYAYSLVLSFIRNSLGGPSWFSPNPAKKAEVLIRAAQALLVTHEAGGEEVVKLLSKAISFDTKAPRQFCLFAYAKEITFDWHHREEMFAKLETVLVQLSRSPSTYVYVTSCVSPFFSLVYPLSTKTSLMIARIASAIEMQKVNSLANERIVYSKAQPSKKLSVVYMSSEFGDNSVGREVVTILQSHKKSSNIIGSCVFLPNRPGTGLSVESKMWIKHAEKECTESIHVDYSMSDESVAYRINSMQAHILVDLNGWMDGNRIGVLAYKPVEVQIGFKNFVASMGADFVTLIGTDRICSPPEYVRDYTEKLVYIGNTFYATGDLEMKNKDQFHPMSRQQAQAQIGIKGEFVFANFNNFRKFDSLSLRAWAQVLKSTPKSSLWLLRTSQIRCAEKNLKEMLRTMGAENEVVISDLLPGDLHLRVKKATADLLLDTFAYVGHSTSAEVLYFGVPVLTLASQKMASRVGASLLISLNLPQFIARDPDDFVEIGQRLGKMYLEDGNAF